MNNNNIITAVIEYEINESDSPWTGRTNGKCAIVYNSETKNVLWKKITGCNPYATQLVSAVMQMVPPEEYQRANRVYPFKVTAREGYSGCRYYNVNLYKRIGSVYVKFTSSGKFDIAATGKVADEGLIYYGDLVEILRKDFEDAGIEFSRNPRDFNRIGWRFVRPQVETIETGVYDPARHED